MTAPAYTPSNPGSFASAATTASQAATMPALHLPIHLRIANRQATLIVSIIAALVLVGTVIAGIALTPEAAVTDFARKNLPPSWEYPFGTDWMGRNMFARTLAGLSTSILIGLGDKQ